MQILDANTCQLLLSRSDTFVVYISPVTVTCQFIIEHVSSLLQQHKCTFFRDVGGDQRFSTPLNGGDHPFVHHLCRGDQQKGTSNFAQFGRPPAPVVNDIFLRKLDKNKTFQEMGCCFECNMIFKCTESRIESPRNQPGISSHGFHHASLYKEKLISPKTLHVD